MCRLINLSIGVKNVYRRDLPDAPVDDELCEHFATYFSDKMSRIWELGLMLCLLTGWSAGRISVVAALTHTTGCADADHAVHDLRSRAHHQGLKE